MSSMQWLNYTENPLDVGDADGNLATERLTTCLRTALGGAVSRARGLPGASLREGNGTSLGKSSRTGPPKWLLWTTGENGCQVLDGIEAP